MLTSYPIDSILSNLVAVTFSQVRARDGFEVAIHWQQGQLVEAEIVSTRGNPLIARYREKVLRRSTQTGQRIRLGDMR
jgi:hypothetical protein